MTLTGNNNVEIKVCVVREFGKHPRYGQHNTIVEMHKLADDVSGMEVFPGDVLRYHDGIDIAQGTFAVAVYERDGKKGKQVAVRINQVGLSEYAMRGIPICPERYSFTVADQPGIELRLGQYPYGGFYFGEIFLITHRKG